MSTVVRRIRADEWSAVRALRLEALRDPAADVAFLETWENASLQPDEFWQERASNSASGDAAAQFIAEDGEGWVGSVTVLRAAAGSIDYHGEVLAESRSNVVGVYVRPSHRGDGLIDQLLDAAASWSASHGDTRLHLGVHVDNARAQRAYQRSGFLPTGVTMTTSIGDEIEMARELTDRPGRRILLVNGPNLNLLGTREPEVYGTATLADVERLVTEQAAALGYAVRAMQSNHEGALIDAIHAAREDCAAVVINPGGLTHTSVALRDALTGIALPFAEVHISDVYAREEFRHHSYLTDVAAVHVVGQGIDGYAQAVRQLAALIP